MRQLVWIVTVWVLGCAGSEPAGSQSAALDPGYAHLDARSQHALAQTVVRPLLPPARLADKAQLMAGPTWFAFTLRDDELTISLHATSRVHHGLGAERFPEPSDIVRGRPARVTSNEGIRAVTWDEGGVYYALEVECYRPFEDDRCKDAYFALDLAEELVSP